MCEVTDTTALHIPRAITSEDRIRIVERDFGVTDGLVLEPCFTYDDYVDVMEKAIGA